MRGSMWRSFLEAKLANLVARGDLGGPIRANRFAIRTRIANSLCEPRYGKGVEDWG